MKTKRLFKSLIWILLFVGFCSVVYGVFILIDRSHSPSWVTFFALCIFVVVVGPLVSWMIDSTGSISAYLGALAVAHTDLSPEGIIRFEDGETRTAISHGPSIFKGEEVTVTEVRDKGEVLVVGRANPPAEKAIGI